MNEYMNLQDEQTLHVIAPERNIRRRQRRCGLFSTLHSFALLLLPLLLLLVRARAHLRGIRPDLGSKGAALFELAHQTNLQPDSKDVNLRGPASPRHAEARGAARVLPLVCALAQPHGQRLSQLIEKWKAMKCHIESDKDSNKQV